MHGGYRRKHRSRPFRKAPSRQTLSFGASVSLVCSAAVSTSLSPPSVCPRITMSLAILTPLSQRPNKDTDRRRWNESWERDLRSSYSNIGKLNSTVRLSPQARQHGQSLTADSQLELYYERTTRDILDLQKDLREKASLKLGTDNLAQKWRELTLQRREALVLEGLYRASSAGQDMEGHRKWCPDLTLRTLSGNGGQGFINLLQQFVPENLDQARVATTPIMISHSGVNQLLRLESFAFLARGYRLHRCYFMTMTLWRILLALVRTLSLYSYSQLMHVFEVWRGRRLCIRENAQ